MNFVLCKMIPNLQFQPQYFWGAASYAGRTTWFSFVTLSVCMELLTYVSRQHQKVNLCSLMRTQLLILVKLDMWVDGPGHKDYPLGLLSPSAYIEGFHVTSLQQNLPSHAAHSGHVGSHKIWPNSLLLKLHKA